VRPRLTAPRGGGNGGGLLELVRLFLRLGATAFGGPAAHIALMENEVVTRRAWCTRAEFLDTVGLVQLLPGPNSTELAIHIGHARAGWRGGVLAGLSFLLPAVALVWGLSVVAAAPWLGPVVPSALWWILPAVVAVLLHALWKFGRQAVGRSGASLVMPLTALAAAVLPSDIGVLAVGALASVLVRRGGGPTGSAVVAVALCLLGGAVVSAQVIGVASPPPPSSSRIFWAFAESGVSVFGSGYVLLAWLQRDLVVQRSWLSLGALTQAAALAQVSPGPLFATATAAGYAIGGHAGALAATVGIFTPAFLSLAASQPLRWLLMRSAVARAALDGIVIASVSLLGRAVVSFAVPLVGWQWLWCLLCVILVSRGSGVIPVVLCSSAVLGVLTSIFHLGTT